MLALHYSAFLVGRSREELGSALCVYFLGALRAWGVWVNDEETSNVINQF